MATTAADIEALVDAGTDWVVLWCGGGDADTARPYVEGTLTYLSATSHVLGCYDLIDDLVEVLKRNAVW